MTSFADVIPEEIQQQLINLRDHISDSIWQIGDISNTLIDMYEDANRQSNAPVLLWQFSYDGLLEHIRIPSFYPQLLLELCGDYLNSSLATGI